MMDDDCLPDETVFGVIIKYKDVNTISEYLHSLSLEELYNIDAIISDTNRKALLKKLGTLYTD